MLEYLRRLFESDFMPHGHCYAWEPAILWVHALSDSLIALSYYAIPPMLVYFVARRRDLAYSWMFVLFGAFIFLCGTTHILEVWSIWNGTYRLTGAVKLVTGLVSFSTAVLLVPLVPRVLRLPSPSELERANAALRREVVRREQVEQELRALNDELEQRVAERTAELARVNKNLLREIREREQAQQALHESQQRIVRILESISDVFFSVDRSWHVVYANRHAERIGGISAEEMVGRSLWELFPVLVGTSLEAIYREAMEQGTSAQFETRGLYTGTWYEVSVYPSAEGISVYARDITERKRAEEEVRASYEKLSLILDRISGFFTSVDRAFRITYVSDGVLALLGMPAEEVVGQPFFDVFPDHRGTATERAFRTALEEQKPVQYEIGGPRTKKWYLVSVYPSEHGISTFAHDITERKETEEALRQREAELRALADTLEQRVRERTEELMRANRVLEQRNRELQEFGYAASHDLKEPLRKIRTFADLLQTECGPDMGESGGFYLKRLQHAAQRMTKLIDDLLTLSRVATRGRPFVTVDLSRIVQEVLEDLEVRLDETDANIEVGELPSIEADPIQMRQLFQNLIGNALKFHTEDRRPRVRVTADIESPSGMDDKKAYVVLRVRDNGIGFDQRYAEKIFTPFQRLHGRSAYEGTGMGLAICRRIVERHGGSIRAVSEPGVGTEIIVHLPIKQDGEPGSKEVAVDAQLGRGNTD